VVFEVNSANCVNSHEYVVTGSVGNPNSVPVYVSEVIGSFYNNGGSLLFTLHALLASPLIAPEDSSSFVLAGSGGCSLVASYQLQAFASPA
jgi:hypothetical protein